MKAFASEGGDTAGADQLDVFWPVRPDYVERADKQRVLYEQVVAPGVAPRKLADEFTFETVRRCADESNAALLIPR